MGTVDIFIVMNVELRCRYGIGNFIHDVSAHCSPWIQCSRLKTGSDVTMNVSLYCEPLFGSTRVKSDGFNNSLADCLIGW